MRDANRSGQLIKAIKLSGGSTRWTASLPFGGSALAFIAMLVIMHLT